MMHISELFDEGLLREMIEGRFIRRFEHDNGDLIGYDYTPSAQWDRVWNPVTLNCRGLIVDTSGMIVARPFPKFFNHGEQPDEDARRLGQPFTLSEKLDGCMPYNTTLNCWDGTTALLGDVVKNRLSPILVGMDDSGKLVPSIVTDWHDNGIQRQLGLDRGRCPPSRRFGNRQGWQPNPAHGQSPGSG